MRIERMEVRGGCAGVESAIKDNRIQVRRLRCTRATVKALCLLSREERNLEPPREHVASRRTTEYGNSLDGASQSGTGLPHFANIYAPYECH